MEAAKVPRAISAEQQRQQIAPEGYFFIENIPLSTDGRYDNVPTATQQLQHYYREYGESLHVSVLAFSDEGWPVGKYEAVAVYIKESPKPKRVHRLLSMVGVTIKT